MNGPHFARNMRLWGHPLRPPWAQVLFNSTVSPAVVASNVMRNTALHLGTHNLAFDTLIFRAVGKAHDLMGIGINDPRTTFKGRSFAPARMSYDEHDAGNPLHVVLIAVAALILTFARLPRAATARRLMLATAAAFVLYCAFLAWQPFGSRFQLPLFVLAAPVVGFVAERFAGRRTAAVSGALLVLGAVVTILFNPLRPIARHPELLRWSRDRQPFGRLPSKYRLVEHAAAIIRESGCNRVGLVIGGNDWEYPVWTMLNRGGHGVTEIRHVGSTGRTAAAASAADRAFEPCAIYSDSSSSRPAWSPPISFTEAWREGRVAVYLPSDH